MATETIHYALGHSTEEYGRLRAQAQLWQQATDGLLDRVGIPVGARCLDAGSGPGETMRSLADRVGPGGCVVGLDVDAALVATTRAALHDAGHLRTTSEQPDRHMLWPLLAAAWKRTPGV